MHAQLVSGEMEIVLLPGVAEEQIFIAGLCTAMHLDVLTSYRAEKEKAGRLAGVIRAAGQVSSGLPIEIAGRRPVVTR